MRPPYPADVVPLLPQFLTRRRTKLDYPLRAMEELGLDRPAFIFSINLPVSFPDGATVDELLWPYSARRDSVVSMLAAGSGAGLIQERQGRFHPTDRAHDYAGRTQRAAHAHLATLTTIPADQLSRLATLLERAFQASAAGAPEVPLAHTPRAFRMRGGTTSDQPMVLLENAVYGLWMVRDDCHVAAWLPTGLSGPDVDVLTRVWRGEAPTAEALAGALGATAGHVEGSLSRLRERGFVEQGRVAAMEAGRALRQAIEDDTDRLFFVYWPEEVGAEAPWIRDTLGAVNSTLV